MPYKDPAMRKAVKLKHRMAAGTIACSCGCGEQIPARNSAGAPAKYKQGHFVNHSRKKPGDTLTHSAGYVLEYAPDHPRAHNGYVYQHVLRWEEVHGPVPDGHQVHHRNGDKTCDYCGSWHPEQFMAFVVEVIKTEGECGTINWSGCAGGKVYISRPGINNAHEGAIKMKLEHIKAWRLEKKIGEKEVVDKINAALKISRDVFAQRLHSPGKPKNLVAQ